MLIQKMKYMQNLTAQEKHIVEYILANPQIVFDTTANELAKLTYTSSSTIVRLCKKLDTKGYPDFQLKLALEFKQNNMEDKAAKSTLNKESLIEGIDSIPYIYEQALTETRRMFDEKSLVKIVDWIMASKRIDIYGTDNNYYIAQQACAKWNEVGVTAIAYNSANQHYLNSPNINTSTVSIIISRTGRNKAMIEIAKILKKNNMKVVAVTGNKDSMVAKVSDETILTYVEHERMYLDKIVARMSAQYILDVLYVSTITD